MKIVCMIIVAVILSGCANIRDVSHENKTACTRIEKHHNITEMLHLMRHNVKYCFRKGGSCWADLSQATSQTITKLKTSNCYSSKENLLIRGYLESSKQWIDMCSINSDSCMNDNVLIKEIEAEKTEIERIGG